MSLGSTTNINAVLTAADDQVAKTYTVAVTPLVDGPNTVILTAVWGDTISETNSNRQVQVRAGLQGGTAGTGRAVQSLTLTITDDDTAAVEASTRTLNLDDGTEGACTLRLTSQPTATVTITATSNNTSRATVRTANTLPLPKCRRRHQVLPPHDIIRGLEHNIIRGLELRQN